MAIRNTYRILIWIIVILVATNISMGVSFWFHRHKEVKAADEAANNPNVEMPSEQRTRFFRDQLDLDQEQINVFRELNREFNRSARKESDELEQLRIEMVVEMGKESPSTEKLDSIAKEVGGHHSELKEITMDYYLKMKAVCDSSQQEKLKEIFLTVSKSKEDVSLPGRGRGFGRRRTE